MALLPKNPKSAPLEPLQSRVSPEVIAEVDAFAKSREITRSAAVAALVGFGLEAWKRPRVDPADIADLSEKVTSEVNRTMLEAVPALQNALGASLRTSVMESIRVEAENALDPLKTATTSVIDQLSGAEKVVREAEGSMRNAGAWFTWKWVAMAAGSLGGVCLVTYAALAWQLHEFSSLRNEQAELTVDVAQMQANVSALENKGGRIVMSTCGGRLCIEASDNQGTGQDGKLIPLGGWTNNNGKVLLVIPKGY